MDATSPLSPDLLDRFAAIVGAAHALSAAGDIAPYLTEPRDKFHGQAPLVLKPGSVDEVSAILELASETATPIVPYGGGTGLVGGQIADRSGRDIVVSLARLNRIRAIDPAGDHMIAEAGVVLADAHAAADRADRLFPLSLASEGTCQIGGNLSTNAGGTAVLAYGNFITILINFLILAWIIFLMVKGINKMRASMEKKKEAEPAAPPPVDILLLTEIRDLLKTRQP